LNVFFTSVVLTEPAIREGILKCIPAEGYDTVCFMLTCSEETLKKRHDGRGDRGETNCCRLRLPPCSGDIVIDTDGKRVQDAAKEMKRHIDALYHKRITDKAG